jgi:hypothetical protein
MTLTYHYDLMQGSEEWHKLRLGTLTASAMNRLLTPGFKVANSEKVTNYLYEVVAERISLFSEEPFQSYDMQRGTVEETWAKDLYAKNYAPVKDCGFITNDKWGFTLGFSPDGLVGTDGGIECKSRCQKFQMETIVADEVPAEFMVQIQTGLLVSERKWWDFVSFNNGMPMYVKRVLPNDEIQKAIIEAATLFEERAVKMVELYQSRTEHLIKTKRREHNIGDIIITNDDQAVRLMSAG